MDTAEFDLDRYLRASKKVDLDGVRWDDIAQYPVSDAEARCLSYMMDIESHTVIYLRDLLATSAAAEPDVTAFLSCWVYEELWHGEALSRFLGEAGFRHAPDLEQPSYGSALPSRVERNRWIRRSVNRGGLASHIGTMAASALIGPDFVATHMTWGAANELATLNGYQRIVATTEHPVLKDLLRRIIKDERRHFAFYRAQARMRLARSERARKVTRWAMDHLWAPVGTGVRPQEETDFLIVSLFGGRPGAEAAEAMDRTMRELPGFDGARLFARARAEAISRGRRRMPHLQASPLGRAGFERAPSPSSRVVMAGAA